MGNLFGNISDLQADDDLENSGIELSFGNGRVITVARSGGGNRRYKAALAKAYEPHRMALEHGSLDNDTAKELLHNVFAGTVVLGWRGWVDGDGQDIAYSKEAVIDLFISAPEIFRIVQEESEKFSNFSVTQVEESGNE